MADSLSVGYSAMFGSGVKEYHGIRKKKCQCKLNHKNPKLGLLALDL